MSYIQPSVTIQQEFATLPSVIVEPLQTCIVGPNYRVFEYSDATDKTSILAGNYTAGTPITLAYGGRPLNSTVDTKSVKLVLEDLWAKYADFASASTRDGVTNRIKLTTDSFVTSAGGNRASSLTTRDVKVGDGVRITYSNNATFDTTVAGFASTPVASSVGTIANTSTNLGAAAAVSAAATLGTTSTGAASLTAYATYTGNLVSGLMSDTYILTCDIGTAGGTRATRTLTLANNTTGTAGGSGTASVTVTTAGVARTVTFTVPVGTNPTDQAAIIKTALESDSVINPLYVVSVSAGAITLKRKTVVVEDLDISYTLITAVGTTSSLGSITAGTLGAAKFSVSSTNGDNITSFSVSAFGNPFYVGSYGLSVSIATAYVAGQSWTISATAPYTRLSPAISDATAYTGPISTVYTIKVVSGGLWAGGTDIIRVSASTNNGIDFLPSTVISTSASTGATRSFVLGSLGLTATFTVDANQKGLVTGESYTISVTAATAGPINKIVLADNPSTTLLTTGATVTLLQLSIPKSYMEIPISGYPLYGSSVALTANAENYVISGSLAVLDSSLGSTQLPVIKAKAYVPYRALLVNGSLEFNTISDISEIDTVLGKTIPANPLAYGVYKALENSNGQVVNYISIATDDITGYTNSIETLSKHEECYFVVPLTSDNATQQLFKSHVDTMSSKTKGLERVLFISKPSSNTQVLYGKKTGDNGYWTGTVPTTTTIEIPGATFITDGVRAGDSVRTAIVTSDSGDVTYTTSSVALVNSQTQLTLATASPALANNSSNRIDIIRNLSRDEQASAIADQSGSFDNRRDYVIWPDLPIDDEGLEVPGHFLACSVAGLKSSVAPHQGITNYTLTGWSNMARSYKYFTPTQLNVIAGGGTMIVTQNAAGGEIYIRHQLSSDNFDANRSELSITTNLDSITKFLRGDLKKLIGKYNNTESFHQLARTMITQKISYLMSITSTATAGAQITSFDPASLIVETDPIIRTTVNASLSIGLPYPVNNFNLVLTVI